MRLSILLSLPAIALVAGASSAAAQEKQTPPAFLEVHSMDVPAGRAEEWKALVDELKEGLRETDHPGFTMWEVIQGQRGRFYMSSPAQTLAELEPQQWLRDVWDEQQRARWWKRFGELVTNTQTAIWRTYPELSAPLPPDAKRWPRYAELAVFRHALGRGPDFRNYLEKTAKPARDKAAIRGVYIQKRVTGGNPRDWLQLRVFDDWTGLDDRRLAESMGEEALRNMALEAGRMVDDIRIEVLRFREDLSFMRNQERSATTSGEGAR